MAEMGTMPPAVEAALMGRTPSAGNDKATASAAPAVSQDGAAKTTDSATQASAAKPKEPAVSDADVIRLLGADESSEQKLRRLERDYAASSKEAKRLNAAYRRVAELLKDQGVELAEEDGLPAGFLAKGKGKDGDFSVGFKELSEDEQALFESAPQKAINLVLERARRGLVRVSPTLDKVVQPLTAERRTEAIDHVRNMVWEDGAKKYPDFEKSLTFIDQALAAASKPLKEFAAQEPELAYEMMALRVEKVLGFLSARAKAAQREKEQKEKASLESPPFGPAGGGSASIGTGGMADLSQKLGKAIAGAGAGY